MWWQVSRAQRSVALGLRQTEGHTIARQLIAEADVLVENFRRHARRLGHVARRIAPLNPGLVMLRILPGYGQTGPLPRSAQVPWRHRRGHGRPAPPDGRARPRAGACRCLDWRHAGGAALARSACVTALYHRKVNGGKGQVIDVALHEAVFNVMESLIPEYSAFGVVREAAGSALPGIAPSNAYPAPTAGCWLVGNGDSIFKRLMDAIGRPDLGAAPHRRTTLAAWRVWKKSTRPFGAWSAQRTVQQVLDALAPPACPRARSTPPRTLPKTPMAMRRTRHVADAADARWLQRGSAGQSRPSRPRRGIIRSSAPHLGDDTDAVLVYGSNAEQIALLRSKGVVQ